MSQDDDIICFPHALEEGKEKADEVIIMKSERFKAVFFSFSLLYHSRRFTSVTRK